MGTSTFQQEMQNHIRKDPNRRETKEYLVWPHRSETRTRSRYVFIQIMFRSLISVAVFTVNMFVVEIITSGAMKGFSHERAERRRSVLSNGTTSGRTPVKLASVLVSRMRAHVETVGIDENFLSLRCI